MSRGARSGAALPALLLYVALSLVFFGRWTGWTSHYFGYTNDSLLFIWFLHWWPFAITHGLNPFICKYAWFPAGYNVTWATSVPAFALLMWPVTALGGPVLSYNILVVTAPGFAAWTGFLLLRDITKDWAVALLCGFLFGFCVPELYQLGQLNLSSVLLVPLAVLLCLRRMQGGLGRRRFVVLLSLLLAAQLGISTEILASLCFAGALCWGVFLLFAPAGGRGAYWQLAADIALCAPLTICLTAPFLYYLVKGLPDVPPQIHPFWLDLMESLRFFVPAPPVHSAWAALASIGKELRGYTPDYNTYVSLPILLILALYLRRHFRKPYVQALFVFIFCMALISLGPVLLMNGRLTGLKLPWLLIMHIPFIGSIVPIRFLLYFTLAAIIITGSWLSEGQGFAARLPRFALAGLACLFLRPASVQVLHGQWQTQAMFPKHASLVWSPWPVQPFFTPAHIRAALGSMPNLLLLPDPLSGPGMAWQINAGLSFTQSGGYTGLTPAPEQKWAGITGFLSGGRKFPDFSRHFTAYCAAHRIDFILIGPGTPSDTVNAIEKLGWARRMDQGIEIVTTPPGLF